MNDQHSALSAGTALNIALNRNGFVNHIKMMDQTYLNAKVGKDKCMFGSILKYSKNFSKELVIAVTNG